MSLRLESSWFDKKFQQLSAIILGNSSEIDVTIPENILDEKGNKV